MDQIIISGAGEHNLKRISLNIPRQRLTVITGVSGSGKSSLAFDTLYREGQRRYLESLPSYVRQFLGSFERPVVDRIEGLSPSLAIDQKSLGRNPRSTVGTLTEIHDHLRLLFAKLGRPSCPRCGKPVSPQTADQITAAMAREFAGRQILLCAPMARGRKADRLRLLEELRLAGFIRVRVDGKLARLDHEPLAALAGGKDRSLEVVYDRLEVQPKNRGRLAEAVEKCLVLGKGLVLAAPDGDGGPGILYNQSFNCPGCGLQFPPLEPRLFSFNSAAGACPECGGMGEKDEKDGPCAACGGARLRPEALAVAFEGRSIADWCAMPVEKLRQAVEQWTVPGAGAEIGGPIIQELRARLGYLAEVGLTYLTLDRGAATLSGGEAQRVRLAGQAGSTLQGMVFVLDEPSIGLHSRDHGRLLDILFKLRDRGNTVVVVEHDRDTIAAADFLVDLGPGAGDEGGEIVAQGTLADIAASERSLTGAYLSGRRRIPEPKTRRPAGGPALEIRGARFHNLQDIDVRIPLGLLVALTGVSGSGKSSLVEGVLKPVLERGLKGKHRKPAAWRAAHGVERIEALIEVDQTPLGRNARSCLATYTGLFVQIRALFAETPLARARQYGGARFSFNVDGGRCLHCKGAGALEVEMRFLPSVEVQCEECRGRRFNRETLEVAYRGLNIAQVLDLTVQEACEFFKDQEGILPGLDWLLRLGLGYLRLGQPATGLSGGESQRIRLASELQRQDAGKTFYVFDEPTTGLHFEDIRKLLDALQALVHRGNTVLIVEHNLEVIRTADHVIDLGPEGGEGGGHVVAAGTPEQVAACEGSHTGKALRKLREDEEAGLLQSPRRVQAAERAPASIRIRGARQHNLRSIDADIPHGKLTVITGVSGAGKSSLAFDTLFAEGRRMYIESLSAYARQFAGKIPPASVDRIDGLLPSIAVDHQSFSRNPQSTAATLSEIYDYLKVLFARAGTPHCPVCREPLSWRSPSRLAAESVEENAGRRGYILAPLAPELARLRQGGARREKAAIQQLIDRLLRDGYTRIIAGGEEVRLDAEGQGAARALKAAAGLVIDRVVFEAGSQSRIAGSLDRAFRTAEGWAMVQAEGRPARLHSLRPACPRGHFEFREDLSPKHFSFNSATGACPACEGSGREGADPADPAYPSDPGSPGGPAIANRGGASSKACSACGGARLRPESLEVRLGGKNIAEAVALTIREASEFFGSLEFQGDAARIASPLLGEIINRLVFLGAVGLEYLQLDRRAATLSGGEIQRIRLASQIGNELVGVLYVLDEPTIGLHPRDVARLLAALRRLRDLGNTVVVVENDRDVIAAADTLIELGPGAGPRGGEITAMGPREEVLASTASLAGALFRGEPAEAGPDRPVRPDSGAIVVQNARLHNLQGIEARFPLRALTSVTGVSGAGKSTLVLDILAAGMERRLEERSRRRGRAGLRPASGAEDGACGSISGDASIRRLVVVDPMALFRTPRSSPATIAGVWDLVRSFFASLPAAKMKGFGPDRFSFNRPGGRCEACKGEGTILESMHFLADVRILCESCRGARFNEETRAVRYKGLNAGDVLELEVDRAAEAFSEHPRIRVRLEMLQEVGLGYLRLGQPAGTLSGGEAQRLKLAAELSIRDLEGVLFIIDEPTAGLHYTEVRRLLKVLHRLVDGGATAIVIENDVEVLAGSDWVLELGPESGAGGGRIIRAVPGQRQAAAQRKRSFNKV